MANPRKFSEKIALQKQKQAEGTAEFEKIMKEVNATKMNETQASQKILEYCLGNVADDSAVNSNKCSGGNNGGIVVGVAGGGAGSGAGSGASGGGASPETTSGGGGAGGGGGGGSPTAYRESRGRSVGVGPMRRPSERKQDRSPYGSSTNTNSIGAGLANNVQNIAYLSPPMDSSWRRSNSDSALHQSLNMAIAGDSAFSAGGVAGVGGMPAGMGSLHANYQTHHLLGQRSQSPNIGRSFSPQAQRRKGNLIQQQQQQQFLQHHMELQHQHQHQMQQQQHQHQLHQHLQMQHQQQQQQQQQSQQVQQHNVPQQQPPNYNAKFTNCNNMPPTNSLFKSLQDQTMTFANTGSLPDLTSVHYSQQQQPSQHQQHHHQQHHQQQHALSPTLSSHNNGRDRDQSPSPFSPAGGGGGGGGGGGPGPGPTSPYQQQHHSPTSAANTPTAAQTSSPHLSFTNLSVQSPTPAAQSGSFGNLATLGAASSAGNLTDYRQPLNPPSPGSSPGLLTSASGNELHTSAPASPTRHPQTSMQHSLQSYNDKNIQNFDRYSPTIGGGGSGAGGGGGGNGSSGNGGNSTGNNAAGSGNGSSNIESSYSSLNPSFHNHFEQFSLGDSNSSPDQTHYQSNNFGTLEFEEFVSGGSIGGQHVYSQTLGHSKILDFNNLTTTTTDTSATQLNSTTPPCNNNNLQQQQQQQSGRNIEQQQQRLLNNNGIVTNGPCHPSNNNGCAGGNGRGGGNSRGSASGAADSTNVTSPLPSPLGNVLPSPSSPLPIPMSAQQHAQHHHQQHNQHAQNHHQQLSLSLHSQHSPHHSPMHSPHHTSNSPLSASSPGGITTLGCASGMVPTSSASSMHATNGTTNQNHPHQQQQQQQQQNHANTPTTNIPSIIFSDYSSNSDFSREIFDTLDLDLEQIDVASLQMLSDQNTVMIADPTVEDSFRRDLN